jgi:glycosyltransferase involved in cell wall biosynthesis
VDVRLTVIVPTIGRPTLERALASCEGADEILTDLNADDDHGYAARTRLIARATGTHLCFLDDDDVFAPGAIDAFRRHASERLTIFRMQYPAGGVIWHDPVIRFGNLGTPCLLVPNIPEKLGEWKEHAHGGAGGDYVFACTTAEKMGAPVWRPEVVAHITPT